MEDSRNDVNYLIKEGEETLALLFNLFTRIDNSQTHTNEEIIIRVGREKVYRARVGQEPSIDRLDGENIKQIRTALERPYNLDGTVSISIGRKPIYHVKDGQVLTDYLQPIKDLYHMADTEMQGVGVGTEKLDDRRVDERLDDRRIDEKLDDRRVDNIVQKLREQELANLASEMLSLIGTFNPQDNSLQYISNYYMFTQHEGQISVTCKSGRGEILNNAGLTNNATQKDIELLKKLEGVVEQLRVKYSSVEVQGLKM